MIIVMKRGFVALSVLSLITGSSSVHAYTIAIDTPTAGSTWSANANMIYVGTFTWKNTSPNMETQPSFVAAFVRAGGTSGVVTNSGFASHTNVNTTNGTGDYDGSIVLKPSSPPIGGGTGNASYVIQTQLFAGGIGRSVANRDILVTGG